MPCARAAGRSGAAWGDGLTQTRPATPASVSGGAWPSPGALGSPEPIPTRVLGPVA